MKKTIIELTKVIATDGMVLTNGDTYSKEIFLGVNDSIDNWYEITEAEYEVILAEEKARINAEAEGL